jgi:hypothetical protein
MQPSLHLQSITYRVPYSLLYSTWTINTECQMQGPIQQNQPTPSVMTIHLRILYNITQKAERFVAVKASWSETSML